MRRNTPKKYTILIARTGRLPLTLSVRPIPVGIGLAIALTLPILWVGRTFYALHQENRQLTRQNRHLSQAADEVVRELDMLDAEVKILQERAGLSQSVPSSGKPLTSQDGPEAAPDQTPPAAAQPSDPESDPDPAVTDQSSAGGQGGRSVPNPGPDTQVSGQSQGGAAKQLAPEALFEVAQQKLTVLASHLHQQVKPALHKTLTEEAAQAAAKPSGLPVKAPLPVSSPFGLRPNPFGRGYELHQGIDFKGPVGTPIQATAAGVVKTAEHSGGYGYHIVIDHGYGYSTLYAHLSDLAVAAGASVDQGELIGYLGSTGRSTGPHLHYSVMRNGIAVDPAGYLAPAN